MRAGPFLLFASREQTEMPEREDDHEALAAGLDIDIGRRIKLRRIQLGLSQSDLARKIGPVAFQQVQKYENGTDRVSASRLYPIAEALGVGIGFFYRLDDAAAGIDTAAVAGLDRIAWASGTRSRSSNASAT
jgi:transcriptional regulator with XRE-family HTH domain